MFHLLLCLLALTLVAASPVDLAVRDFSDHQNELPAPKASDKYYNWTVDWSIQNPDGVFPRRVISVNGEWPLPVINVTKGDRVVIDLYNDLGTQNVSLHFHGLFQKGQNAQDGPVWITQYGQYPDGLRQSFLVSDPDDVYKDEYDEHLSFTLSDWYHEEIPDLMVDFMSKYNPDGSEPVPSNLLFNDTQNVSLPVEPNKTYKLTIINVGAFVSQYIQFEDHKVQVIEVDGVATEKSEPTDLLYITSAQRYSVLLRTKDSASRNFAISTAMDSTMLDSFPSDLQLVQTNYLEYNPHAAKNPVENWYQEKDEFKDDEFQKKRFDDMALIPVDRQPLLPDADHTIVLDMSMNNLDDGINYAFFNNITFTHPKVPVLYTVLSSPNGLETNPKIYGSNANVFVLKHNEVVDVVLNNKDDGAHPFHLHGRNFQVPYRSPAYDDDNMTSFDPSLKKEFSPIPMRRDTVYVRPGGNFVLRYRANNPGVWFFHCHIEWHMSQGLALVMVEAPAEIKKKQTVPENHLQVCQAGNVPTLGNAAANAVDWLDLAGQNLQAPGLPHTWEQGQTWGQYVSQPVLWIVLVMFTVPLTVLWFTREPCPGELDFKKD
ncbi:Iron transport multicopper oxidase FET3 [Yarrowia sp. E02]|nr:Iron transport multicopper oxidase FET3 [Yarrowia sp. E02]